MPYLLNKLQLFFGKIRQSKRIQIVLGVMPGLFCFIYTVAFLIDTLNVFGTLTYNNLAVTEAQKQTLLYEVDKQIDDTNLIKAGRTFEVIPVEDEPICIIERIPFGFNLQSQGNSVVTPHLDFITYDENEDLYFINGSEEGISEPQDSIVCRVFFKDNKFFVNDGKTETELISTLNFNYNKENNLIDINSYFTDKTQTVGSLYFVSNLSDTKLHYDGIEQIYVQQINKDFLKNFLIGTNVLWFSLIVILYVAALIYANKYFKLEYFASKPVIAVNVVGLSALLIGLLLAVILLS